MKRKYIICLLVIFLIFGTGLSNKIAKKDYEIINNPAGWNLPDISLMKRLATKEVSNKFICDVYDFQSYEDKNSQKATLPFVLNKIIKIGNIYYNEELSNYEREWPDGVLVIRAKDDNNILFFRQGYFWDKNNAEDVYDYISGSKYAEDIYIRGIPGEPRIGVTSKLLFDIDDDRIYESVIYIDGISVEDQIILIKKIKDDYAININKEYRLPKDLIELKAAWIKYIKYPSQENMQSILPLLSAIKPENINSSDKDQKQLWKGPIRNKLDWGESMNYFPYFIDSLSDQAKLEFWGWICQSTNELERNVYTSDRDAVKICFKLIPFAVKNHSGRVGRILDRFIQINPQMFLEELEEHYQYIRLEDVLDGNFGLELIGKADLKYLENENKIAALKRVQNTKLMKLRDQCIDFLEKELKYLCDNFYLKESREEK